jgi:monothiol glutaredoxin
MSLDEATRSRISELVESKEVVLFMKGNPQSPQCGFSARVVQILDAYLPEYSTLDVLSNPDIREGLKSYSSWPTIPQLYVRGEFIGGCDIITEMSESGELFEALGVEPPPEVVPTLHITDKAAAGLRQAAEQNASGAGQQLRLSVSTSFESALSVGSKAKLDIEVESNGVTLLVDRLSAQRAEGITIDIIDTPRGPGFKVDNPNAPSKGELSVQDLKQLLDTDEKFELLDVRTPREFETARIEGAHLLDEAEYERIQALPKDTKIVLFCHHGPRGANMADQLLAAGFTNVHNVVGGIEAWSDEIDASVPRY